MIWKHCLQLSEIVSYSKLARASKARGEYKVVVKIAKDVATI